MRENKLTIKIIFTLSLISLALNWVGQSQHPDLAHIQLAPQSQIVLREKARECDQLLSKLEELKDPFLKGKLHIQDHQGQRLRDEVILESIHKLADFYPQDRKQYLQGRKMLSWWLFFVKAETKLEKEVFGKVTPELDRLHREADRALRQWEDHFIPPAVKELSKMTPRGPPEWPEEAWMGAKNFDEEGKNRFLGIFHSEGPYKEVRRSVDEWLVKRWPLLESIHLIYGVGRNELLKAFKDPEGIHVRVTPLGSGDAKFVLLIEVTIQEQPQPYTLVLKGFWPWSKDYSQAIRKEVATLQMLEGFGVSTLGVSTDEKDHEMWLEEFIPGFTIDKFLKKLAESERDPHEISYLFQSLQLRAAKHFLWIEFTGFSGTHFIRDPHLENIMTVGPAGDPDHVDFKLMDVGSLAGASDTVVIDVGSIQSLIASQFSKHFYRLYDYYYVKAKKIIETKLPQEIQKSLTKTGYDFLMDLMNDAGETKFKMNERDKVVLLSLLVRGVDEIIHNKHDPQIQREVDEKMREFLDELFPFLLELLKRTTPTKNGNQPNLFPPSTAIENSI